MFPLRLAIPTEIFRMPLKKSVIHAARLGVKGIRIAAHSELKPDELTATGTRQLLHHLREPGIAVAAVQLPLQHRFTHPQYVDEHVSQLKSAMGLAASLQAKVVLFQPGPVPSTDNTDLHTQMIEILNDIAQLGNHIGVTPTLSVSSSQPAETAQLFKEVTTGQVGLNFDPAAVLSANLKVAETVRLLHESIMHVTARDLIDDGSERGRETVLGQGDVDWLETVALLGEIEYREWITIDRMESAERLRDIQQGFNFLKNLAGADGR